MIPWLSTARRAVTRCKGSIWIGRKLDVLGKLYVCRSGHYGDLGQIQIDSRKKTKSDWAGSIEREEKEREGEGKRERGKKKCPGIGAVCSPDDPYYWVVLQTWACPYVSHDCSSMSTGDWDLFPWSPGLGEGGDWWRWRRGNLVQGIPRYL